MTTTDNDEHSADSAIPTNDPEPRSRWKKHWSALHWRAHCLVPKVVAHPAGQIGLYLDRDEEENQKSKVSLEAELRTPTIWGVELYGPAEIDKLYAGLKKVGWKHVGGWRAQHRAAEQVRRMRSNGSGAWLNIGSIWQRGEETYPRMNANYANLPDDVDSLMVTVSQVTASLTALVIGFQLKASVAQSYETAINDDRSTRRKRVPGSWTVEVLDPRRQKRDAVAGIRAEHRAMVGSWIARHFPGYFCGQNDPSCHPTMELLVARDLSLFEGHPRRRLEWQRLLTGQLTYDVWDSVSSSGLQLGLAANSFDDETGLHIFVALDPSKFSEDKLEGYGASGLARYTWYCDHHFTNFLTHLATIEFLKIHAQDLHTVREQLKLARSRKNVARTLDEIGQFFEKTLGSPAIVAELAAQSEHALWYQRSCGDFASRSWDNSDSRHPLAADIQASVNRRSKQLSADEAALRTHLDQITSILSVRENIRLQRWTVALSIAVVLLALTSFGG